MGNYIKLNLDNIIRESQTIAPEYCNKKYVIYYNPKENSQKVRINTDYFKSNQPDKLSLLKRNMDVLKKGYPDLGEIVF